MSAEGNNCGNCRYYTPFADKKGWGYCHRYPPSGWKATSFAISGSSALRARSKSESESRHTYEGKIKGLWEQPQMEPHDWCGEYRPVAEPEELAGTSAITTTQTASVEPEAESSAADESFPAQQIQ